MTSEAEYHADPALSHSRIEDLMRCPSLFHARHIARTIPPWEGSAETELGSALHKLVLEGPERYAEDVAIWRGGMVDGKTKADPPHHSTRRGTKAWKEFEEAAKGKTIISEEDHDTVERLAAAIYEHKDARTLLHAAEGATEQDVKWSIPLDGEREIRCKARFDKLIEVADVGADLKTSSCVTFEEMRRQAIKLGYHRKAEWYRRGYLATRGRNLRDFVFVTVRTVYTPIVWVWRLDSDVELVAEIEIDLAVDDYRSRLITGDWLPSKCTGVHQIGIMPYEYSDAVRREMENRAT